VNAPRTYVEWAFGLVQQYFPWVDDVAANNLAVTPVGLFYQAAVLLTNWMHHMRPTTSTHFLLITTCRRHR
jgi:hypothetical protein